MGVSDTFDPQRDGWSFRNWYGDVGFSWDLYRRSYLGISPTESPFKDGPEALFYKIFKTCAKNGNCGGMTMLALAIFKYGAYMGFSSPPSFYAASTDNADQKKPARQDLHEAINIMQAHQFSAAGIRNFLDVLNNKKILNDGFAAFQAIRDGLDSGDYCILSLANSTFGADAHTVIPYRAEKENSERVLYVWNPNLPYAVNPRHYDEGCNKIIITGPKTWSYNQNIPENIEQAVFSSEEGDGNGAWFFAVPMSANIHKDKQPLGLFSDMTGANLLLNSGVGEISQIEDEDGRRLFTRDRRSGRTVLETSPTRQLEGVVPWLRPGGASADPQDQLFIVARAEGSSPLNISVQGGPYKITHMSPRHSIELTSNGGAVDANDHVRLEHLPDGDHAIAVRSSNAQSHVNIHHLRCGKGHGWRSVRVRSALPADDTLRVHAVREEDDVELAGETDHEVEVEFKRYDGTRLLGSTMPKQRVSTGRAIYVSPADWHLVAQPEASV